MLEILYNPEMFLIEMIFGIRKKIIVTCFDFLPMEHELTDILMNTWNNQDTQLYGNYIVSVHNEEISQN